MNPSQRTQIIVGGCVAVAVMAFLLLRPREPEAIEITGGTVYYNGPMKAKGGDTFGTANGESFTAQQATEAELNSKTSNTGPPQ